MKKVVLLAIILVTIIKTIPTIYLNNSNQYTSALLSPGLAQSPQVQSNQTNKSTGNTTNQGLAVESQGQIYYSDGTNLWSMNKEGSSKVKIKEDIYPKNIQVVGDRIYYIHGQSSEIYWTNKEGTRGKKVSTDKAYSLNIYKNKLYFMDRHHKLFITAMSLDGHHKSVIQNVVVNDMMIYNDYIYYLTREGSLGKVTIEGENNSLIATDVMQFDVGKRGIYYTYDPRKQDRARGLYRLDFDDSQPTQLISETPYSFNAHGDDVYYNHPEKMSLYKMLYDGTRKREITGANSSDINLAGNYIFFKNLEDGKKIYRVNQNGTGRMALQGKTLVTNVTDLTKELDHLEGKEISPKLKGAYEYGKIIAEEIIKPHMADYEKVKVIHDYIINNTRYDVDAANQFLRGEISNGNAFTAYGVFANQKGVCQGYAEATQILLSLAGIPSELVIGYVEDEVGNHISHMWNMVFIHNKCYMIDTTWDDPVGPEDVLVYDYFLIDSETLKKDHHWAYDEYPECN